MLIWFSKNKDLYQLLAEWRETGTNYNPDQPIDNTWEVDGYEELLGNNSMPSLFENAVQKLFRYDIFPPTVMRVGANFLLEDRFPVVGDRIIQRIRIIPGIVDAITMNIISAVWHEPDRRGFTLITSDKQYKMGEWTASISRKKNGEIALMVHVISRPSNQMPVIAGNFARKLQLRAHRLALKYFHQTLQSV